MKWDSGPLAHREFRLLLIGRTVSFLGGSMSIVAMAFAVLELTGSRTDVGIVLAAQQIPKAIFLLLGGVWADRIARHRVMVATNVVSGVAQSATAGLLLFHHAHIWSLVALAMCNGSATAFFTPAAQGAVPDTVPEELLQPANATLRLFQNGTNILGTALAGVLVAAAGPGYAILVDGLSFFVSAAVIGAMRTLEGVRTQATTVFAELREGWRDFRSRTWLWAVVLQFSVVNAVHSGSMSVIGPSIAKSKLGGAAVWGAILAAQTAGFVLTGFLMLRLHVRRLLFLGTLCVFPIALPLLALAKPLPAIDIAIAAFFAGAGIEVFAVAWYTVLQREVPRRLLSRVSAWDEFGSIVVVPFGLIAAGPVSNAIGTRATLLGSAGVIVLATAVVLLSRDVRRL